ncbi:EF-hand domain-containing protein [Pelagibius marinus]|uniref:EF-hand domain-containing protein n=1 Tax=Pelagibius marinus TaxID=2762760 RepID=UPI0018730B53|nr:EF-hand domain-containing protein [Pelagibius marinus]
MKKTTKLAVAFVALAGIGATAVVSAQADSRWQGRDGAAPQMTQQAYGGHHMRGHHSGGGWHGRHGGGRHGFRMMEAFDANDDGKLSQEEIDSSRAERFGKFDGDGDQSLTLQEYEQLWLDAMRERMVDRFQDLDADGDAKVTAEEFKAPFAKMVRRMDRNEDGVIDRNDFRRHRGMGPGEGPGQMRGPQTDGDNG